VRRVVAALVAVCAVGGAYALARAGSPRAMAPAVVDVAVAHPVGPADVATGVSAGAGRVLTVAHVLGGGRPVRVRAAGRWRPARVLAIDRRDDLAVLAVAGPAGARAAFATGAGAHAARLLVRRGGRTRSLPAAVRRSVRASVEGSTPPGYRRPALELAAAVAPRDSGAPVVAADGRVVGIVFARGLRGGPAIAYAVDGAVARALLGG
jgi:S1-C subfamily serine protease